MKYLLFLLTLSFCVSSNKETKTGNAYIDTVFLDKEKYPDLFVEPVPESRFSFINGWGAPENCKQNKQNGFPNKWIETERLNGEYCFYLWFGPGGLNKLFFCNNDFYVVQASGDHLSATSIVDFIKKSDKQFAYLVSYKVPDTNSNGIMEKQRYINFYIIDEKNRVTIVEDPYRTYKYYLAIAQDEKYDIPILVHQNYRNELHTYVAWNYEGFDKVDYEKILKEKDFKADDP